MKIKLLSSFAVCLACIFSCISFTGKAQGFQGIITVGPGGQYPNLTGPGGFFDAMNNNPFGSIGGVEIRITGNLCEPGTNFLDGGKLHGFACNVYPNPGAPLPIVLNNCSDINQGLIRLDGVANTTISGLTFINTNTTPANAKPVIEFINNSSNVIIENNSLRGNDPNTFEGTLMLGGGVHTNAIIRNNTFSDATGGAITNYPGNGIYANNATDQLQITNNIISNNTNYGIFLNTGNGTVVDGNRIFQTVPKTASGGGILVTGGGSLTVTNNIIGNGDALGGGTWTQTAGDFYGIYALPNTFAPNPLLNSTISGNTIEDVAFNSPGTPSFSGIFCQQGSIILNNNIIRNNNINANGFVHGLLLSPVTNSIYSVTGNTISGITNNNTGSASRLVGIRNQGGGGGSTFTNNSITNLQTFSTNSSTTSPALAGMEIASSAGAFEIYFNTFSEIYNPGPSPTTVAGINTNTFSNTIDIQRNTFSGFRNAGAAGSNIFGINIQGGNSQVINNFLGITNNGNTNDVSVTGLNFSGSSSSTNNIFYNSVFIGNTISAGSSSTYCFRRSSSAVVNLMNNALVNNAIGGIGNHHAIANTRSSSTATGFNGSNYNFLYTQNSARVGLWNATVEDFPSWITVSQKDGNSLTSSFPEFDPQVFWDPATGVFTQAPGNNTSWFLYGNAIPIAGITMDQRGIPGIRPDLITNGTPDIGAFELDPPTVNPPPMIVTGPAVPGATQNYFFGGQRFASILWGPGGTVPATTMRRFSQPPAGFNGSNPGNRSISNYFDVTATGGSGFTATPTFFWFPNADGRISPVSNAVMGKKETGGPWFFPPGSVYASTGSPYFAESITAGNIGQFSLFTALDPSSTLPVNLLSFKAQKKNNDIILLWSTAGETDHDHYELERSIDGIQFSNLAMVPGNNNNTTLEKNYSCTDTKALLIPAAKLYYRVKMVSRSGNSSYSNIIQVPLSVLQYDWTWKMSPNPFQEKISVNLYLPENSLLELRLYNTVGELLHKKSIRGEKGFSTIEMTGLDNLVPGSYYLQLRKDGQPITEKLIKTGHQ